MDFWNRSWFEKWLPVFAAVCSLACAYFMRPYFEASFVQDGWIETNLYTAVFDWSAIQSGFMFAIYGFVATKKDGFTGTVMKGQSFQRFISYTRTACVGGFALTIYSLPLLVVSPEVDGSDDATYWIIAIWFAFFVWAFLAFLRVAFSFGIIIATKDREPRTPG